MKIVRNIGYGLIASLCLATSVFAQKITVHLDPAQTEVRWTLTDTLHTIRGTFRLKGGVVTFDPRTGIAEGELLVDAASGESGNSYRDKQMKKLVLESERYPQIFFHPTKLTGELKPGILQDVTVDGTFNIHGADHALRMGVKIQVDGDKVTATTHFIVPFVDWGMKDPSNFILKVGKQVDIDVVSHGTIEGMSQVAGVQNRGAR
jgi:polyisoprenoid-binding protein YceI